MRFNFKVAVVAGLATAVFTITATAATAAIGVSTAPGTAAPPATLAFYKMTPFGDVDTRATGALVTDVPLPLVLTGHPLSRPSGSLLFSTPAFHYAIGAGWASWSHGYTGDVYYSNGQLSLTTTLPAKTGAFYLYAEPNPFAIINMTVTGRDATGHQVTTTVAVNGAGGAQYFGFYNTTGGQVSSVTVSSTSDFAIGEFGISNQMLTKLT
jgi:hypothetical protein